MGITIEQAPGSGGGGGGRTLIGTLTTTSGATTAGVAIDSTYLGIYVEFEGVSFSGASGSNALKMAISANAGSSYGTAVTISTGTPSSASDTVNGVSSMDGIQEAQASKFTNAGWANVNTAAAAAAAAQAIASATAGNVDMVRFATGAGNFDAGTIRVYGVK